MPATPLPDTPTLVLDAASPLVSVGLFAGSAANAMAWRTTSEEAGVGLFPAVEELLRGAQLTIADVRAIILCEGPGSLLGIRLAAMAVRTWMALPRALPLPVFGYRSLALVAADLLEAGAAPPFHVVHDARRETWNVLTIGANGRFGEIRRCAATELPMQGASVFCPQEFPRWQPAPAGVREVPYRPSQLPLLAPRFPLLHATAAPDAFMTEMPTYRTWTPTPPP